jgi:hypothetical protein
VWRIAFVASLGDFLLFGYDWVVIGGAKAFAKRTCTSTPNGWPDGRKAARSLGVLDRSAPTKSANDLAKELMFAARRGNYVTFIRE